MALTFRGDEATPTGPDDSLGAMASAPRSDMFANAPGAQQYGGGAYDSNWAFANGYSTGVPGAAPGTFGGGPTPGDYYFPSTAAAQSVFPQFGKISDSDGGIGGFFNALKKDFAPGGIPLLLAAAGGYMGGPGVLPGMEAGAASMPAAILDTGGAAMMPAAIPPVDPTFGGNLIQSSPGVFEAASAGGDSGGIDFKGAGSGGVDMLSQLSSLGPDILSSTPFTAGPGGTIGGLTADASTVGGGGFLSQLASNFPGFSNPFSYMPGESEGMPGGIEELLKKLGLSRPGGGPIAMGMNALSLLQGLKASNQMKSIGATASAPPQTRMETFDPMGYGARAPFLQQLNDLRADPSKLADVPGYKAGLDAITRKIAAAGYLGSGNMKTELLDYGGNAYNKEIDRLTQLSGANLGPQNTIVSGNPGAAITAAASSNDMLSKALATGGYFARGLDNLVFGSGK